jgi:hypothetical protein
MLNSATIDIDTAPLGGDEYDEAVMDYEMRPESDEEEATEGCEEEAAEEITQEEAVDVLINPALPWRRRSRSARQTTTRWKTQL